MMKEGKHVKHFGVNLIKKKYSFYLTREEFALINTKPSLPIFKELIDKNAYIDDIGSEYKKEWCEEYRELCLKNYDLNMKYFKSLNKTDFENAITNFLNKYKGFRSVENLSDFDGICGYYIMVLDKYKQVYIGKSENIKRRILSHWSSTKAFDRTLFPMYAVETSCFSIDFFRALDTTRIFVWERELSDRIESKLVKDFPKKYCTNHIGGDASTAIEALITLNMRNLK